MTYSSVLSPLNIFPLQPMKLTQGVDKNALLDAIGKNCEFMSTDMLLSLVNDFIGAFGDWGRRQTLQTAEKLYRMCSAMACSTVAVQSNLTGIRFIFVYKMVRMSISLVQLPAVAAWNAAALCSRQGSVDYQVVLTQVSFYLRQAYTHIKQFPIPEFPVVDMRFALNFTGGIYLETQLIKEISQQTGISYVSNTVNIAQKIEAYNKLVHNKASDYVRVSQVSEMETLSVCRRSSIQYDDSRMSEGDSLASRSQNSSEFAMAEQQSLQAQPYSINFGAITSSLNLSKLVELVNYLEDYYSNLVLLGHETRLFNDLRIVSADRAIFFHCFERFLLAFNGLLEKKSSYALSVFDKIALEYERNSLSMHGFYQYFAQTVAQLPESRMGFDDIGERLQKLEETFQEAAQHTVMIYPKGLSNVVQGVFIEAVDSYRSLRTRVLAVCANISGQLNEIRRLADAGIGLPDTMQMIRGLQAGAFRRAVTRALEAEGAVCAFLEEKTISQEQTQRLQKALALIGDLKTIRPDIYGTLFKVQAQLIDQRLLSDRASRLKEQREKLLALKPNALAMVDELQTQFERELKSPVEFFQFCITNQVHFRVGASPAENVRIFQDALRAIEKKRVSLLMHYDQELSAIRTVVLERSKNFLRSQLDVEQEELAQPAADVARIMGQAEEVVTIAMEFQDAQGQRDGSEPPSNKMGTKQLKNLDELEVSSDA